MSRMRRCWRSIPQPASRHSRERGLCFTPAEPNIQSLQRHPTKSSFPRTRESRAFRARTFEVAGFPPSRE
ncbi:hypothetical protein [Lysobacter gummosus]|uniref:hypothetical protein n=1 Tax=Lysobacter gummosus TaxID=262324 RepID=UPI003640846C